MFFFPFVLVKIYLQHYKKVEVEMIIMGKVLLLPDGLFAPANYFKTKIFDVMTLFFLAVPSFHKT